MFAAPLNLHNFPADSQTMVVKLRVPRVDEQGISSVTCAKCELGANIGIEDNWKIKEFAHEVYVSSPGQSNFKPEYHMKITLQRKSDFYVKNVAIPITMFVLISFSVFLLPVSDMNSRYSIILTILLTLVAFKLSVASWVPVLSYETALDNYNSSMIFIIFLSAIVSALVFVLPENWANDVNFVCGSTLFVLFLLLNVYWSYWIYSRHIPNYCK